MSEKRQPWLKLYTKDWRADAALRMCSFAARGLWFDMMTLMHEGTAYGFLLIEGITPTARQLAGLLGGSEREVKALLRELGEANVYSVTGETMPGDVAALIPSDMPAGVIFSRRMVRDKAKAERDRENGSGGGNPNLRRQPNRGVNPPANPQNPESRNQKNPIPVAKTESGAEGRAPREPVSRSTLIDEAWSPSEAETAAVRAEFPWMDDALFERRMRDFRDWCDANATRTFSPAATWRGFMRKTQKPQTASDLETFEKRRIQACLEAIK